MVSRACCCEIEQNAEKRHWDRRFEPACAGRRSEKFQKQIPPPRDRRSGRASRNDKFEKRRQEERFHCAKGAQWRRGLATLENDGLAYFSLMAIVSAAKAAASRRTPNRALLEMTGRHFFQHRAKSRYSETGENLVSPSCSTKMQIAGPNQRVVDQLAIRVGSY
jgi:hypothetical protein